MSAKSDIRRALSALKAKAPSADRTLFDLLQTGLERLARDVETLQSKVAKLEAES